MRQRSARATVAGRERDGRLHSAMPPNSIVCEDLGPHASSLVSATPMESMQVDRPGYYTKCWANGKVNGAGHVTGFCPSEHPKRPAAEAA